MVEKFQKPENAREWLDEKFATTRVNSPFVQAVLDKTHLDFAEPFKQNDPDPKDIEIYAQIEKRIKRRSEGKQGVEYSYTMNNLQYHMGSYKSREKDDHYRFWEAKAIAYREALLLVKYRTVKPTIEHVIVELEELEANAGKMKNKRGCK